MEINIWHIIDSKWVHIVQITKDDIREYYTDGKLTGVKKVNKDGTIKVSPLFIFEHNVEVSDAPGRPL